ncbi:MAG: arginine--tRNA ligase, partial [Lachnospiraceae bacterium]|nr:arginine--tRNA ligase [Lachnospiraceae bacterium]
MIYLYVDPRYQMNYSWTERYSVLKQAARKRRTEIPEIQSLEEIPADDSKKAVLIRSASKHFISETVNKAINMEIPAIVLANIPADAGLPCSTIGSDLSTRALIAIRYLRSIGCGRTALFAVNPSTYSDEHCEKVFLHMGGKKEDVYYMSSGLNKALESLVSRIRDYDPAEIIYVTDDRQILHFKQFFIICAKMGMKAKLVHVPFGLMSYQGKAISTREGNLLRLDDLLAEATRRAYEIVKDRGGDEKLAEQIGYGAVKYTDLSHDPITDIDFSWDKALALEGNSGPYLQYAYARVCSLMEKAAGAEGRADGEAEGRTCGTGRTCRTEAASTL